VLGALIDESAQACRMESVALEPRERIPDTALARATFAIVWRGHLLRERVDARGRRTVVDAAGPGSSFPLPHGDSANPRTASGYALDRVLLCLGHEADVAQALGAGGATALDVHRLDAEAASRLERLAEARARSGSVAKVAALLCALADTLRPDRPGGSLVPAAFSQRDLAALLSLRHESVCRSIGSLVRAGCVRRDADGIHIVDRTRLEAY
jgi:CRP-like cAMP-binding protein